MHQKLFLLCACLLFAGCSAVKNEPIPSPTPIKILDVSTFETDVQEFHQDYKRALFTTGQEKVDEAKQSTETSLKKWKNIEEEYKSVQPKEYLGTQNWNESLESIRVLLENANMLCQNEQFLEAHELLEDVRKKLFTMREQNNRKNLSDQMLIFHDIMEELIEKKEEDPQLLAMLQKEIIPIAEKQGVPAYQDLSQKLKKMTLDLSEKEGESYYLALQEIKRVFVALYLQFG